VDEQPASTDPIINITGELVALGPLCRDLVPLYLRWVNDFEVTRMLGLRWNPMTTEQEQAWYDGAASRKGQVDFTIYKRSSMRPIGNTGLMEINHQFGTAEFGIMIGEKECWGRGYGTEVARLILDYGFTGLGLRAIMLRTSGFNERGQHAYLRAGFKVVGRLRNSHRLGDRVTDVILMDCIAEEFESPSCASCRRRRLGPSHLLAPSEPPHRLLLAGRLHRAGAGGTHAGDGVVRVEAVADQIAGEQGAGAAKAGAAVHHHHAAVRQLPLDRLHAHGELCRRRGREVRHGQVQLDEAGAGERARVVRALVQVDEQGDAHLAQDRQPLRDRVTARAQPVRLQPVVRVHRAASPPRRVASALLRG
jgi:RimJ/RimL family protein N-acetyltransferase